jgi:hypothetical protein
VGEGDLVDPQSDNIAPEPAQTLRVLAAALLEYHNFISLGDFLDSGVHNSPLQIRVTQHGLRLGAHKQHLVQRNIFSNLSIGDVVRNNNIILYKTWKEQNMHFQDNYCDMGRLTPDKPRLFYTVFH